MGTYVKKKLRTKSNGMAARPQVMYQHQQNQHAQHQQHHQQHHQQTMHPEEAVTAHDEMDVLSYRTAAATRYVYNNDWIENVLSKYIPFHNVIPPTSFPDPIYKGEKLSANGTALAPSAISTPAGTAPARPDFKVEEIQPLDVVFGSLELMKLKSKALEGEIAALEESPLKDGAKSFLSEEYYFQSSKLKDLRIAFNAVATETDFASQQELLDKTVETWKNTYKKKLDDSVVESRFQQKQLFVEGKVSVSVEELREQQEVKRAALLASQAELDLQTQSNFQSGYADLNSIESFDPNGAGNMIFEGNDAVATESYNGNNGPDVLNTDITQGFFTGDELMLDDGASFGNIQSTLDDQVFLSQME
ncbi:unnamed protein product [Kuraishia capsulata CBS 1993]|uniref:Uncharacterized protein n=1 Tax=Kuraishia capsulata CBS 1993 TaxID=1382522 RepID=W6MQ52_9ASCO|nr:uncharacterized protein KUCA_T00004446001 [Kuraishia capsulata CBS 1993]CDK28463.1 unnamed protein product [Kuraishia capsulata CBS 1993]